MKSDLQKEWDNKLAEEGLNLVDKIDPPKAQRTYHSIKNYYESVDQVLHNYSFDSQLDKLIWECHAEGLTRKQTAAKLGIGEERIKTTLKRIRIANGLPAKLTNRRAKPVTEKDKAIIKLREQGLSYSQIAQALGLPRKETVYQSLRRQGVPKSKTGRKPKATT
jgi:DNA-binding CsgD family transcriptional regulator